MTYGCVLPCMGPLATEENLRTLTVGAEEMGLDHVWAPDHIVFPTQISSRYPYNPEMELLLDPAQPFCEPLSTLCYLAGCTSKIKLGTYVLVLPYREPVFTAKIVSTLDYMSGGRVILGVGVGWMEEEFVALGQDTYKERGLVSDEHIAVFKELWTKDDPEFQGKHSRFSGIKFEPKPAQRPHPPIWVGGNSKAARRRAARLGDAWLPFAFGPQAQMEPDQLATVVEDMRDMSESAGRPRDAVEVAFSINIVIDPPAGIEKRTMAGSPAKIADDISLYREAGVEHFVFWFQGDGAGSGEAFGGDTIAARLKNIERFATEVRPRL